MFRTRGVLDTSNRLCDRFEHSDWNLLPRAGRLRTVRRQAPPVFRSSPTFFFLVCVCAIESCLFIACECDSFLFFLFPCPVATNTSTRGFFSVGGVSSKLLWKISRWCCFHFFPGMSIEMRPLGLSSSLKTASFLRAMRILRASKKAITTPATTSAAATPRISQLHHGMTGLPGS